MHKTVFHHAAFTDDVREKARRSPTQVVLAVTGVLPAVKCRPMGKARNARRRRFAALAAGALLGTSGIVVGAAVPAEGAPPANDTIENALTITGIPSRAVQDTSEAVAEAGDGRCVRGASVWYRFRPTTTSTARVVTIGSDFDTLVAVFRGSRANRTRIACNDDAAGLASAVVLQFKAGARYWIALSACCDNSTVGGRSVLMLYPPRPASTTMSLGSADTGAVSGRLFASGTVRCGTPSVAGVRVTVSQRVGTLVARGSGFVEVSRCGSTARPWEVRVDSKTGVAFQQGLASVTVHVESNDGFNVAATEQTANIAVGSDPNRRSSG